MASCIHVFIPLLYLKRILHPLPVLKDNTGVHVFVFLPGHFSYFSISWEFHTYFQSLGITPVFVILLYLKGISHPLPVFRDNICDPLSSDKYNPHGSELSVQFIQEFSPGSVTVS